MPGKQAKILSTDHIEDLLFFADHNRSPLRNRVIVLLSIKAGLRAGKIAKLTWDMVLGASGQIGPVLELRDQAAKMRSGRVIPFHAVCNKPFQLCGNQRLARGRSFALNAVVQ
jgi:integrase